MGSATYASGKHALAECDRCGQTFKYRELRPEYRNHQNTGLRVCKKCLDPEHPQEDLGRRPIWDPQALRHARPDKSIPASTSIFHGWNPVGFPDPLELFKDNNSLTGHGEVGTVTVTTS